MVVREKLEQLVLNPFLLKIVAVRPKDMIPLTLRQSPPNIDHHLDQELRCSRSLLDRHLSS